MQVEELPLPRGTQVFTGMLRTEEAALGRPASPGQPGTHLHHRPEGHSAVGLSLGEGRQPAGGEALGDAAGERQRLGAPELEAVSHQASKQDHEGVACCSGENNPENVPGAWGGGEHGAGGYPGSEVFQP